MKIEYKSRLLRRQIYHYLGPACGESAPFSEFIQAVDHAYCHYERKCRDLLTLIQEARFLKEKADRTKSEFLAYMSHELRTPLNAIIGYSEMLADELGEGQDIKTMREDINKIHKAGKHLLALIEEILALTRIESGKIELVIQRVEVQTILNEIAVVAESFIQEKNNSFSIKMTEGVGTIETDIAKLSQILLNLLSNAGKFTLNGRIAMTVYPQKIEGEPGIAFEIKDSGIGIPPTRLHMIFEYFSSSHSGKTYTEGGAGIGLAMTQRFCHLLGGDIQVESVLGEGSTFTVVLPLHFRAAKGNERVEVIKFDEVHDKH